MPLQGGSPINATVRQFTHPTWAIYSQSSWLATLWLLSHKSLSLWNFYGQSPRRHTHTLAHTHRHTLAHTCTLAYWILTNTALPSHSRCQATLNRFETISSWRSWKKGAHDTCASSLCGCGNRLSGTFIFLLIPHSFFLFLLLFRSGSLGSLSLAFGQIKFPVSLVDVAICFDNKRKLPVN